MKVEKKTVKREVVKVEEIVEKTFVLTEEEMVWVALLAGRVGCDGNHPLAKIYREWADQYNQGVIYSSEVFKNNPVITVQNNASQVIKEFLKK